MPTRCSKPRSRPAPRTSNRDEDGHRIWTSIDSLHEVARALEPLLGEAEGAKLAWRPSDRSRGPRRRRRAADEADRRARGGRRRPDRLGQLRRPRRRAGEARLKILGLDPGLGTTGWGLIEAEGNRLTHIANGQIKTDAPAPLPQRLAHLADQLEALIAEHRPDGAAVEEVFVNKNPQSTLKLGQARGVVLMCAARAGIDGRRICARGWSRKRWSAPATPRRRRSTRWSSRLLPGVKIAGPDAADALAVAITHAHHLASARRIA